MYTGYDIEVWIMKTANCIFAFLCLAASVATRAATIQFEIQGLDTVSAEAALAIDFIDGDGVSNNIQLGSIFTDGVILANDFVGSASTILGGYSLSDDYFYNNVTLFFSEATVLSLVFETSNVPPALGMFSDSLSVYLVDAGSGLPVVLTDEPLGSNALAVWTATGIGDGTLSVYGSADNSGAIWSAVVVPEPGGVSLFIVGLAVSLVFGRQRKGRQA